MARKNSETSWGNFKIPQMGWDMRIIEMTEGETKKGDMKLTVNAVCNWYDPDEEENQASFWVNMLFSGDTAERHADNLKKGDIVLVIPTQPLQASTSDNPEYATRISFNLAFPFLKYLVWGKDKDEDEGDEKPRRRSSKQSEGDSGSSRKRGRDIKPLDEDEDEEEEQPRRSRKRGASKRGKSKSNFFG